MGRRVDDDPGGESRIYLRSATRCSPRGKRCGCPRPLPRSWRRRSSSACRRGSSSLSGPECGVGIRVAARPARPLTRSWASRGAHRGELETPETALAASGRGAEPRPDFEQGARPAPRGALTPRGAHVMAMAEPASRPLVPLSGRSARGGVTHQLVASDPGAHLGRRSATMRPAPPPRTLTCAGRLRERPCPARRPARMRVEGHS